MLVFKDPQPGQPITKIGMQNRNKNGIPLGKHTVLLQAVPPPFYGDLYHYVASLEDVQSARVFYDQDARCCKGILFTYCHGGQQALGQCGINVFREETIIAPKFLYHRLMVTSNDRMLDITFASTSTHVTNWIGWGCIKMTGTITFWCDRRSAVHFEVNTS